MEQQEVKKETLEDKFLKVQEEWNASIHAFNSQLKDLPSLNTLLNQIFAKRQDAVDYYYALAKVLGKLNNRHQVEFASAYSGLKMNSQLRFTSESSINTQVEATLSDINEKIILVENQVNYMKDTIKTIDNLVYAIKYKVDIYKMMNGVKF